MTFKPLTDDLGGGVLMSYLEAFPVRTFHAPEKVQESKASGVPCGNTWRESSVKFDLATLSWKTHQCLWEEDLAPSSLTLPKWGMMQSGALWERTTSPLLTSETESGCYLGTPTASMTKRSEKFAEGRLPTPAEYASQWPTPTCADATMGAILNDNTKLIMLKSGKLRKISNQGVSGSIGLARTVAMWPTPRAGNPGSRPNGKGGKILSEEVLIAEGIRERGKRLATPQAQDFRTVAMWPTPTCHNAKECDAPAEANRNTPTLCHLARGGDKTQPKHLNPPWVEWLMGFPIGWTDLKPLVMDKFQEWLNSHGKH
jgi:hypothetical protein